MKPMCVDKNRKYALSLKKHPIIENLWEKINEKIFYTNRIGFSYRRLVWLVEGEDRDRMS